MYTKYMIPYALQYTEHPTVFKAARDDLTLAINFFTNMPEAPYCPQLKGCDGTELGVEPKHLNSPMPEMPLWSCSALCRAAVRVLPFKVEWTVRDGALGQGYQTHTWLEHRLLSQPDGSMREGLILDIYPPGDLSGPRLLDGFYFAPWERLYVDCPAQHTPERIAIYEAEATIAASVWHNQQAGRR